MAHSSAPTHLENSRLLLGEGGGDRQSAAQRCESSDLAVSLGAGGGQISKHHSSCHVSPVLHFARHRKRGGVVLCLTGVIRFRCFQLFICSEALASREGLLPVTTRLELEQLVSPEWREAFGLWPTYKRTVPTAESYTVLSGAASPC